MSDCGDAKSPSVKALSIVKAPSEAGGCGGEAQLMIMSRKCEDYDFGTSYRVRTYKYCRSTSWSKTPLASGIFPAWDPLTPWYQGKREKPLGSVCKFCPLVSRR